MKDTFFSAPPSINCRGFLFDFSTPRVMGILNITPDSFYAGSRQANIDEALRTAGQMLKEGADIIDIGGYSSRPGADDISTKEETERVVPVIEAVQHTYPNAIISVDTFRAEVAQQAVEAGAAIVNDISAGTLDPEMWPAVADLRVPYVLMHMRGTPQTMTQHTHYEDVLQEVMHFLSEKMAALRSMGVHDVIVDPGFGFAKTPQHGFELLAHLEVLQHLKCPVMVGVSRKSMVWKTLGITPDQALNGTTVLHSIALQKGAHLLRVHDVKEAVEAVRLHQMVVEAK